MNSKQSLPSSSHITFIVLTFVVLSASYGGNETDHEALLNIKSMISSQDPYGPLISWNTSFHFCDWSGVSCGKKHRRVTSLALESLGLKGSLSPHVGNLSFLRVLSFYNNTLQGSIPHEIGRLSRLSFLSFEINELNSVIPSNLSRCSNLQQLWLGHNQLVGSIPKEIGLLSKLTVLSLHFNNLIGGIPPSLGNITSMIAFDVVKNTLGGTIPITLGHWKNVRQFLVGDCNLYGTIPHSLYNLSLLSDFSLSTNHLTGSLPLDIGVMLPRLVQLQLRTNQLTGPLPSSLSNCSRLSVLDMSDNKFTGKLTVDFAKLKDISKVILGYNVFGSKEDDEMKFIDSLKNCSRLYMLNLYDCKFQGVLPRSIGNLSDQLRILDLQENRLHGNVPLSIGNLLGLSTLVLADNLFTGHIPLTIGKLQNLGVLGLYDNTLSGTIPDVVGNMSSLIYLGLFSNMLEGLIPSSLGNCHNLLELHLYENKLNGKIPPQLFQLPSLSKTLDLSQNNLSGLLPPEVGDLKILTYLDLSHNKLSGNIPSSLEACASLSRLYLNGNLFQGMIPSSLSSLRGLEELDLSHNSLSGQIPRFLERFSLKRLNLSFNDFEGEVPMLGVFANASAFFVLGNSKLCGGIVELGLPNCKDTIEHKKRFPLFAIVISIVSTLITIICLVYVWSKKKTSNHPSQSSSSMNEQFMRVSYNQLLEATNGFSEANLIGTGGFSSVYKGVLGTNNQLVAVKVLHLQNRRAQRTFLRECEALRSIRHRNILKIITSCSSIDFQGNDFKALVYEFMPNGSLHDWLHSNASTSRLNLFQRINILIDVACALNYIHSHCLPTLVHGDLKPSNILLDDDMVAHVGDFGLARFLGTTSLQNSSSGIRGTIGYAAPEYGLGSEITSSGDVYSFGILSLEMMTGKKPIDDIFNEGLSLHKLVSMALPDYVTEVIDHAILSSCQENEIATPDAKKIVDCMSSIFKIGLSCSVDSPPQRMDIKMVIHELKHVLDTLKKT